jgi:hypothetical protein
MSDDIVKRLRIWVDHEMKEDDPAGLIMAAADEIERLRWERMGAIVFGVGFGVAAIATAALFCSLMVIKG